LAAAAKELRVEGFVTQATSDDLAAFGAELERSQRLTALDASAESYATQFVELLLESSHRLGASDLHLRPAPEGLDVAVRIDGVLQSCGVFPAGKISDVVARLKVLADLLTYRTDLPQEGRVRQSPLAAEIRVSSFPTLHGEKVVVRLFAADARYQHLEDLGLPADIQTKLTKLLDESSLGRGRTWRISFFLLHPNGIYADG
jgi:type II secretory ATPase GspE/PulE/Tfp pilus assembly ATPase PilB-like protein